MNMNEISSLLSFDACLVFSGQLCFASLKGVGLLVLSKRMLGFLCEFDRCAAAPGQFALLRTWGRICLFQGLLPQEPASVKRACHVSITKDHSWREGKR